MNTTTTKLDTEQAQTLLAAIVAAVHGATERKWDNAITGFTLSNDRAVWLNYSSHSHRVRVAGIWPKSRLADEDNKQFGPWDIYPRPADTEITTSADKSPEKIAAEIQRRFMPAYEDVLALCLARRTEHENYVNTECDLASEVASALGYPIDINTVAHWQASRNGCITLDLPPNLRETSAHGDVEITGSSVGIQIRSLPKQQALRLIEFLKTL
jgi:hypothetical protein